MPAPVSFEAFVAARYGALLRAAFVLTGDRGLAEDLLQSAFMRAYPAWSRGEPDNPEAYTRTIMVRLAVRGRRRLWRAEIPAATVPEALAVDPTVQVDQADALRQALSGLSVEHRAVLVLRFLSGLSEAETAAVLRCSTGTVKSRCSRALIALRTGGLLNGMEVLHD